MMFGLLKSIDIFKVPPDPTLQGNKVYHSSRIGQCLTILVVLSGLALLIYFSLDMIEKTNPRVQNTSALRSIDMILNNETFPFTIGVMNSSSKFYVDNRIYTVKAFYTTTNRKVNMVLCDPNTPSFKVSGPESAGLFWCLSDKQDGYDQIGLNRAENIAIDIVTCQNTSTFNSCLPSDEITSRLYGNRLRVFYNDFTFEPDDYENPLKQAVRYTTPSFTTKMVKQTNFNIGQTNYISDYGWLLKDVKSESKVTVESITQFFEDREVMGSVVKRVYLRAITNNVTITRTYDKFQDVIPRWNAIFTLLLIISKIICDSYYKFKAQEKLVRDIIFFEDKSVQRLIKLKTLKCFREAQKDRPASSKSPLIEEPDALTEREKDEMRPDIQCLQTPKKNNDVILYSKVKNIKDLFKEDYNQHKDATSKNLKTDKTLKSNPTKRWKKKKRNSLQLNQLNSQNSILYYKKANSVDDIVEDVKLEIEDTQIKNQNNDSENTTPQIEKANKYIETKSSKNLEKNSHSDNRHEISFCTWLCSQIKPTEQYKLFLQRSEVIQNEFNFQNYAKRIMGIDILKYLVLTNEQHIVFDNCVKAYVNLKLHALTQTDGEKADLGSEDMRLLVNNHQFDQIMQEIALKKLRANTKPDESTRKMIELLYLTSPYEAELES